MGVARKDFYMLHEFDAAIIKLQANGVIDEIWDKWIKTCPPIELESGKIGSREMIGVPIIVVGTILILVLSSLVNLAYRLLFKEKLERKLMEKHDKSVKNWGAGLGGLGVKKPGFGLSGSKQPENALSRLRKKQMTLNQN